MQRVTERVADRLLHRHRDPAELGASLSPLAVLADQADRSPAVGGSDAAVLTWRDEFLAAGGSSQLADRLAALRRRAEAIELAEVVQRTQAPVGAVRRAHSALCARLGLTALGAIAADRPGDSSWTLTAKAALREQLDEHARSLVTALLLDGRTVDDLITRHDDAAARFAAVRAAALSARGEAVAVLAVVVGELDRLRQAAA